MDEFALDLAAATGRDVYTLTYPGGETWTLTADHEHDAIATVRDIRPGGGDPIAVHATGEVEDRGRDMPVVVALDADQLQAIRAELLDLLRCAEAQAVQSGDRGRIVGVRTAVALAASAFDRLARQGYAIHENEGGQR